MYFVLSIVLKIDIYYDLCLIKINILIKRLHDSLVRLTFEISLIEKTPKSARKQTHTISHSKCST
jgi:hypothetical protein